MSKNFIFFDLSVTPQGRGKGPVWSTQTLHREQSQFPCGWLTGPGTSDLSSHTTHCWFTIICFVSWLGFTPEAAMVDCPLALLICKPSHKIRGKHPYAIHSFAHQIYKTKAVIKKRKVRETPSYVSVWPLEKCWPYWFAYCF